MLGYLFAGLNRVSFHLFKPGATRCTKACGIVLDLQFIYAVAYVVFAFLGVFMHRFLFGFHLLNMATRSADMRNILKAIRKSGKESLLILLLFFIAEFLFSLIAFASYHEDVPNNLCVSLLSCFLTYVDQTFKVCTPL